MAMQYKDPIGGTKSSIGDQLSLYVFDRNSLIEMQKEQYFTQMSDTTNMPKHFGKTIKKFVWIPMLDDRNVNDQGLDASGAVYAKGNIYGSSKDVGTIVSRLPVVGENGGRVNRVGFTRVTLQAEITKLGFFTEFTEDSVQFDSEEDILRHYRREMMYGANEISEDALQIDLLNAAGIIRYAGVATQDSEVTGEGTDVSEVDYDDLMRMAIDLRNNHTPLRTKIITGSTLTDTRVIADGYPLYVGSEMLPTLKHMADPFGNPAFIAVQHYADGGNTLRGEVGTVDHFRIIVVPEMQHFAAAGASATAANKGYMASGGKYDIFPMLCVGGDSFTTIGFQSDGKNEKYKIITKMYGEANATTADPYGETGLASIKWWYGTLVHRPERIALLKTVARR
ncbi:MAG: major capsid protein [Podoviridae sp. ctLUJ1]|nr:MAG: major capsid protein [Podoviridae sp. ctLUJ1]